MRHPTGTVLLIIGVLASGACSSAAATTPATTPATTTPSSTATTAATATTATTAATDQATGAVDPGMVLSGEDVVTSAEVDAATEAAANG